MAIGSSNKIPNIRGISDGMKGKNYPFNDCMALLMESIGENSLYDYWFFSWITGDSFVQVYDCNSSLYPEYCLSGFLPSKPHIHRVFESIGYSYTYIDSETINHNKQRSIEAVKTSIDRGIPVLINTTMAATPIENSELSYTLFVGYEDFGDTLIFINPYDRLIKYDTTRDIKQDWIIIGEKKVNREYSEILKDTVKMIPSLMGTPSSDGRYYGVAAFTKWAEDVKSGRFDNETDLWANYGAYFCNLATNAWANNIADAPHAAFLVTLAEYFPSYIELRDTIGSLYSKLGNGDGKGGLWKEFTDVGGGFNVSNDVFKDKGTRIIIAWLLRKAADIQENILQQFRTAIS